MNLSELQSHLLMLIKDKGGQDLPTSYLTFLLNNGQNFICTFVPTLLSKTVDIDITEVAPTAKPADSIMIRRVYFDGKRLTPTTIDLLDKDITDWRSKTNTPEKYYLTEIDRIGVYPFKEGTLTIHYNPRPIVLTTNTQEPDYDNEVHDLIVLGGFKIWLMINEKYTEADRVAFEVSIRLKQIETIKTGQQRDKKIVMNPDSIR